MIMDGTGVETADRGEHEEQNDWSHAIGGDQSASGRVGVVLDQLDEFEGPDHRKGGQTDGQGVERGVNRDCQMQMVQYPEAKEGQH